MTISFERGVVEMTSIWYKRNPRSYLTGHAFNCGVLKENEYCHIKPKFRSKEGS